jgi:hypothetical protein
MKRRQLFELEDQSWFPATIRDLATDYLHFVQAALALHRPMVPIVAELLSASGSSHIVDLCSGGAGPLPQLLQELADRGIKATATLTDLFPNVSAFDRVVRGANGSIAFVAQSVDARAVPSELKGLRTIFNGFHHFKPEDAAAILRDAARSRQPIAIFEVSQRRLLTLLPVLLMPLAVWLATPFVRPFRWKRLLYTYLVPLVPLTCLWDGIVSQLRAYTPAELEALGPKDAGMTWRAGYLPFPSGPGRLTYLTGSDLYFPK